MATGRDVKEGNVLVPAYLTQREMEAHECLWHDDHVECPDRLRQTIRHCEELGLFSRMKRLPIIPCSDEVVSLFHSEKYVSRIARSAKMEKDKLKKLSDRYDSIYLCRKSYECALLASGAVVEAAKAVVERKCAGAIALIRPPGHHAMKREANGFCIFNNVGIAASYALKHLGVKRILIVDWDVHYGQGTQKAFYRRSDVLCVSIHRHERGTFWPCMEEAEFNRIGNFDGEGYNINIPLNQVHLTDADYLAIFRHIIIPIAMEYKPELVFVSAGFDAAVGCPEGNMLLTPQLYGHLTNMLMAAAGNKLVIALEGGYCLESLSWSVSCVIRALLRDPLFALTGINVPIRPCVVDIIHLSAMALKKRWRCMRAFLRTISTCLIKAGSEGHCVLIQEFIGKSNQEEPEDIIKSGSLSNVKQLRTVIGNLEKIALTSREPPMPRVHLHILNESSDKALPATTFSDLPINHRLRSRIYCTLAELNQNDQFISTPSKRTRLQHYTRLMYTAGQIVYSIVQRQMLSGLIAGDLPCAYIVSTLTDLVSTLGKHNVKRPLMVSTRGNIMFFKQTHLNDSTCLWMNAAFIPVHEARRLESGMLAAESKVTSDGNTFSVRVDLPASRLKGAERLFVLQQLLLPVAYSHCPDFVVVELDLYESFSLGIQPSFYSYMISNLMALASGRILVIASAKNALYQVEKYLLSVLAPLAGCDPSFGEPIGSASVGNECILMTASAICELKDLFPTLRSIFLPSREDGSDTEVSSGDPANTAGQCRPSASEGSSELNSLSSKDKPREENTASGNAADEGVVVEMSGAEDTKSVPGDTVKEQQQLPNTE